jgi:FAD/FMN-containing dehydrogenase
MTELTRRDLLKGGSAAAAGVGLSAVLNACGGSTKKKTTATKADPQKALDDLRKRLKGKLLQPADPAFGTAGEPANGRYEDVRPLAIAQCADEADVVTCVKWSVANGIPPVPRGGGHSYAGYSTTRGLLVDVGTLNSVAIDAAQGTAVVGGAARNQNVYDATKNGPFFLPGGTCLGVAVGGLTLGGGIGYQSHWAGLTCDHLLESRIVTASGDVLTISPTENSDLFWACRGGAGGNFGINTQFKFQLVRSTDNVGWYRFDWTGAEAAGAVFSAFHKVLEKAPQAFNAVASSQPVVGPDPRAAVKTFSRGQYIGALDDLKTLVQPLLDAAKPDKQLLQTQKFWDTYISVATAPEAETHSWGDISRFADKPLPDDVIAKMVDTLVASPSKTDQANGSMWSLGWIGGKVNDVKRADTAYVHRNMLTLLRPTPVWPNNAPASVGNDLMGWTDDMIGVIAPHTPAESYQNFPNRRLKDWQTQYYAENYPRLVQVKGKYDRNNLFQNPQSIPPR